MMDCRIRDAVVGVDIVSIGNGKSLFASMYHQCPFYVQAIWPLAQCVVIGTVQRIHGYTSAVVISRRSATSSSKWLERHVPTVIMIGKHTKP